MDKLPTVLLLHIFKFMEVNKYAYHRNVCCFWYQTLTFANFTKFIRVWPFLYIVGNPAAYVHRCTYTQGRKCCERRYVAFYKHRVLIFKNCALVEHCFESQKTVKEFRLEYTDPGLCGILLTKKNCFFVTADGTNQYRFMNNRTQLDYITSYSFKQYVEPFTKKIIRIYKNNSHLYVLSTFSLSKWKLNFSPSSHTSSVLLLWTFSLHPYQEIHDALCLHVAEVFLPQEEEKTELEEKEKIDKKKKKKKVIVVARIFDNRTYELSTEVFFLYPQDGKVCQTWKMETPPLKKSYPFCCYYKNFFYFLQTNRSLHVYNVMGTQRQSYAPFSETPDVQLIGMHVHENHVYLIESSNVDGRSLNFLKIPMQF